jgi:hypothetical protein
VAIGSRRRHVDTEALHAGRGSFGVIERRPNHDYVMYVVAAVEDAVARAERVLLATRLVQDMGQPVVIVEVYVGEDQ